MSPVWTPQNVLPDHHTISSLSPDAEVVWQALLDRHQKRQHARESWSKPIDAQNYYQTLYQRCFGTPQSVRNFETSSVRSSQISPALPPRGHRLSLPETPTPGTPVNIPASQRSVESEECSPIHSNIPSFVTAQRNSQELDWLDWRREPDQRLPTFATTESENSFVQGNSVFDQDRQFLRPMLHHDDALQYQKQPSACSGNFHRRAPAAASRLSDLMEKPPDTINDFSPWPVGASSADKAKPSMGHFELGCEILGDSQTQTQDSTETESCEIDPSQSLFTQPDSNQDEVSETPDGDEGTCSWSSSPPLDLSPLNETLLLWKLQQQTDAATTSEATHRDQANDGYSSNAADAGQSNMPGLPAAESPAVKTNIEAQILPDCTASPSNLDNQVKNAPLSESTDQFVEIRIPGQGSKTSEKEISTGLDNSIDSENVSIQVHSSEAATFGGLLGVKDMPLNLRNDAQKKIAMTTSATRSSVTRRLQELHNLQEKVLSSSDTTSIGRFSSPMKRRAQPVQATNAKQQTLEAVLKIGKPENRGIKRPKKTFSAPFKSATPNSAVTLEGSASRKTASTSDKKRSSTESKLRKVWLLSQNQQKQLAEHLMRAEEVAMTLMYDDGSTQLRELPESKKKKTASNDPEVNGLAIAYPVTAQDGKTSTLQFVGFSLGTKTPSGLCGKWCRQTIQSLMGSETRKLCFDAQESIQALLDTFPFEHSIVNSKWQVIDPRIAGWLLQPDNPPVLFKDLLMSHSDLKQTEHPEKDDQVCSDLSLLGPIMLNLYHKLTSLSLWQLYMEVEVPLVPILAVMERRSIRIDKEAMASSCALLKVLFEELQLDLKLPQKSKKIARTSVNQQKSTSEAVLTQLQDLHPLPKIVLEYRQLQKLKSTYIDGMMAFVQDGQLHTHWDQTAAATGRLTSTNPNIQAIPKQPVTLTGLKDNHSAGTDEGTVDIFARAPFTSREGWSLLAADFQQVELRLLAHFSGDKSLLEVFNDTTGPDIFVELTSQWLNKSKENVTEADREQTKRVVYSVMYGAGKDRLAEYLKISSEEAKGIMLSFLVTYPGVDSYTKTCVEQARKLGYHYTVLQRKRWLPHINHPNPQLRAQAERQAVNFCIQGSAADLCKVAMIQVERSLAARPELRARQLFQIHDELLIEVPDEELPTVAGIVQDIMQSPDTLCNGKVELKVPIKVSLSVGKSWGHMQAYAS